MLGRLLYGLMVAAAAATFAFATVLQAKAAEAEPVVIEIHQFQFSPPDLTLRPGDRVIWKNLDIVPHTATAKDGSWDTGSIAPGESWETVVTAEMLADYYCRFHPSMIATLTIQDE